MCKISLNQKICFYLYYLLLYAIKSLYPTYYHHFINFLTNQYHILHFPTKINYFPSNYYQIVIKFAFFIESMEFYSLNLFTTSLMWCLCYQMDVLTIYLLHTKLLILNKLLHQLLIILFCFILEFNFWRILLLLLIHTISLHYFNRSIIHINFNIFVIALNILQFQLLIMTILLFGFHILILIHLVH